MRFNEGFVRSDLTLLRAGKPRASPETTDPAVLLTRYMDNNYIALLNIPPATEDALRTFFCLFHSTVYDILLSVELTVSLNLLYART